MTQDPAAAEGGERLRSLACLGSKKADLPEKNPVPRKRFLFESNFIRFTATSLAYFSKDHKEKTFSHGNFFSCMGTCGWCYF